jgi:hypothetical protein
MCFSAADCGLFVSCRGYHCEQLDEAEALRRRERFQQGPFSLFRGEAPGPQHALAGLGDHDGIGPAVFIGALARDDAALEHAPYHLRKSRTINARRLHERRLADAIVLLECTENEVLLLRQISIAGLARIKIAVKLMTSSHEMRRRFRKLNASVCLSLALRHS